MKRILLFVVLIYLTASIGFCQQIGNKGSTILFHGIIMDASTLAPLSFAQIYINNTSSFISHSDGTFGFYVSRNDTVKFQHIGYKTTLWLVSDSLKNREFIAGIFMHPDTVSIGEVIIVPRLSNLRSEIMNAPSKEPPTMNNARYNVAISGYQGRTTTGKLGDPSSNYGLLRQQQRINAYEKGGIPSDMISGINPFLLVPAAYLLIHGLPEKAAPMERDLTNQEIEQINEKYLEYLQLKKQPKL
jgi:hypothetical protein